MVDYKGMTEEEVKEEREKMYELFGNIKKFRAEIEKCNSAIESFKRDIKLEIQNYLTKDLDTNTGEIKLNEVMKWTLGELHWEKYAKISFLKECVNLSDKNFRELVNAGFTDTQALIYLANLIGYITVNRKK